MRQRWGWPEWAVVIVLLLILAAIIWASLGDPPFKWTNRTFR